MHTGLRFGRRFGQALGILFVVHAAVAAEPAATTPTPTPMPTHYISDQLSVGLRAGAAKDQKVINNAQAGEPVQILDKAPGTGFLRVRAASGPEGWIEADKVVTTAPAVARFSELQKKYDASARELDDMKLTMQDRSSLQERVDVLQRQVVELENQNEKLNQENVMLQHRDRGDWMWTGGMIVGVGVLLGWLLGSVRKRSQNGWR